MFDRVTTEDISAIIDELIQCLGVRDEIPVETLLASLRTHDTQSCVQAIANALGLPILIRLHYAPRGYRAASDGFHSNSLSRTDRTGHGIEGITAQVSIPPSLPLFGSSSLSGYPIDVRVSENCCNRPETFITVMAHELSHVLLRSLCHPQRDSELHTDLVPILLGFRECVRKGRKDIQNTTAQGKTTTHTTTYGYLSDSQFDFACNKVIVIINRYQSQKHSLMALIKQVGQKLRGATKKLAMFRIYLTYLDTHRNDKIKEQDARRIVEFHSWGYAREWEDGIRNARAAVHEAGVFVHRLKHYTSNTRDILDAHVRQLALDSKNLEKLMGAIEEDITAMRRHVSIMFRIRIIFSPKQREAERTIS